MIIKLISNCILNYSPGLKNFFLGIYRKAALFTVRKKIRGTNNKFNTKEAILKNVDFKIFGNDNIITFGFGSTISNAHFIIRGNNHIIKFGDNCKFSGTVFIEDCGCVLDVGPSSTFEDVNFAITESNSKIVIGSDCMFSNDIDLRTGDSHPIMDKHKFLRLNRSQNIIIGDHVWVCARVVILKGVYISNGCVVGSSSVVTKACYEDSAILAGNPARVVKSDILWYRDRSNFI